MHAVTATSVKVALCIDLEAVWDPGVDVSEDPAVAEGSCTRVDVVFVAVGG